MVNNNFQLLKFLKQFQRAMLVSYIRAELVSKWGAMNSFAWNVMTLNLISANLLIRDEGDLFDVTNACEDEQVQAHKLILLACSPFFKSILGEKPHQHSRVPTRC